VEHKGQRYALVLQLRQRFTPLAEAQLMLVTDLPTGLTSVVDTAAKTVTISGTQLLLVPTQLQDILHHCVYRATISGTVTRNLASTIVLTRWNTKIQRYALVLQLRQRFGGSATDATVTIYLLD
jgi:hypothetical protein